MSLLSKKKTLQCFSCSYIIKPSKEKKIYKWWVAVRFVLIEQYYCGKVIQKQKNIFHVCKIILAIICLNQKIVYGKAIQFFKQTLCCISQNNLFIFSSKLYGRYCTLDCDKQMNLWGALDNFWRWYCTLHSWNVEKKILVKVCDEFKICFSTDEGLLK